MPARPERGRFWLCPGKGLKRGTPGFGDAVTLVCT